MPSTDLSIWGEALAEVKRAEDLLRQGDVDQPLEKRVADARLEIERSRSHAEQKAKALADDRALIARLESIAARYADAMDDNKADLEFTAAFRDFGLEIDRLGPEEAGRRLGSRSEPVELAAFVSTWAIKRRSLRRAEAEWRRLVETATAADPDPWRNALRARIGRRDATAAEALGKMADDEPTLRAQPVAGLLLLAMELMEGFKDLDRAEAVLRLDWQLHPDSFWVNFQLGGLQWTANDGAPTEQAIPFYTAAIAIRPRSIAARTNLATTLAALGKLDEAIAMYREIIRMKPDFAAAYINLGTALGIRGQPAEQIAAYREALRLDPDDPRKHAYVGDELLQMGRFGEALDEFRKARDLTRSQPEISSKYEKMAESSGRKVALAARLPAVMRGDDKHGDPAEAVEFGMVALKTRHYSISARLFAEAFRGDPTLAPKAEYRSQAAHAAAMAGARAGDDRPALAEPERARWRKQAVDWLRADLAIVVETVESGKPRDKAAAAYALAASKRHPDLAGIRDPDALAKLPESERAEYHAFWAELGRVLDKARAPSRSPTADGSRGRD